jgi:hypothetical protein
MLAGRWVHTCMFGCPNPECWSLPALPGGWSLQVLNLENWQQIMFAFVRANNMGAAAFFIGWVIVGECGWCRCMRAGTPTRWQVLCMNPVPSLSPDLSLPPPPSPPLHPCRPPDLHEPVPGGHHLQV